MYLPSSHGKLPRARAVPPGLVCSSIGGVCVCVCVGGGGGEKEGRRKRNKRKKGSVGGSRAATIYFPSCPPLLGRRWRQQPRDATLEILTAWFVAVACLSCPVCKSSEGTKIACDATRRVFYGPRTAGATVDAKVDIAARATARASVGRLASPVLVPDRAAIRARRNTARIHVGEKPCNEKGSRDKRGRARGSVGVRGHASTHPPCALIQHLEAGVPTQYFIVLNSTNTPASYRTE